ncbi:uncharacterized protein VTP21DRAFT_7712 [Calcarisporiella thermophila]|uniref:uncharacterized protein n=1 Tax=Calcarisporiella thermophila TaxID=911321 RepID=UPI003742B08A
MLLWERFLLLFLLLFPGFTYADNGFTHCYGVSVYMTIYNVTQSYLPNANAINLTVLGATSQEVPMQIENTLATGFPQASILNWLYYNEPKNLCTMVDGGCPIRPGNVTIRMTIPLPGNNIPIGDVTTKFSARDPTGTTFTCLQGDPIPFHHSTWQLVFTWTSVAITLFSSMATVMPGLVHGQLSGDVFIYTSNYAMESKILRAKTPGLTDLFFYAQFLLASGQLNLSYPKYYQYFVADFSWAGLFLNTDWLMNIARSTYTGGSSKESFSAPPPPTNNAISPAPSGVAGTRSLKVSAPTPRSLSSSPLQEPQIFRRQASSPSMLPPEINPKSADSAASFNISDTGLGRFASITGIDPSALFLTVLIWFCIIFGVIFAIHLLIWVASELLACQFPYRFGGARPKIINFAIGNMLRLLWIFYLPLLSASFFQLMSPSVWYLDMIAALMIVFPLIGLMAYVSYLILRVRPPSMLFDDFGILLRLGPLYNMFTDETFQFFLAMLLYRFLYGAIIGLTPSSRESGTAQIVVLCAIELAYLVGLFLKRPYADNDVTNFHIFFSILRTTIMCFSLVYIEAFRVSEVSKQWIGYIQILLHCIAYLVFFVSSSLTLFALVFGYDGDVTESLGARLWKARLRQSRQGGDVGMDTMAAGDPRVEGFGSPSDGYGSPTLIPLDEHKGLEMEMENVTNVPQLPHIETTKRPYSQQQLYDEYLSPEAAMVSSASVGNGKDSPHDTSPVLSYVSGSNRPVSTVSSSIGDEPPPEQPSFYRHSRRSMRKKKALMSRPLRSPQPLESLEEPQRGYEEEEAGEEGDEREEDRDYARGYAYTPNVTDSPVSGQLSVNQNLTGTTCPICGAAGFCGCNSSRDEVSERSSRVDYRHEHEVHRPIPYSSTSHFYHRGAEQPYFHREHIQAPPGGGGGEGFGLGSPSPDPEHPLARRGVAYSVDRESQGHGGDHGRRGAPGEGEGEGEAEQPPSVPPHRYFD